MPISERRGISLYGLALLVVGLLMMHACNYGNPPMNSPTPTSLPFIYEAMPTPEDQPLTLLLILDRVSYRMDEPIEASMVLKNISNDPLLINQRFALNHTVGLGITGEFAFIIERSSGEMVPMPLRIRPRDLNDGDFRLLLPGESSAASYDLTRFYELDADTYRIYALYGSQWNAPDGRSAWQGSVLANPATFTVVR